MPIKNMTPEEIKKATEAQVLASAKSTDKANRLPGETASEANARITAAYKEMQAKPVLSKEQAEAGATVQYVRTGAGGVGEYTVVKPMGYTGPTITKDFTSGIIRPDLFYTTVNGQGGIKTTGATGGAVVTGAGGNVKTLPNGSYTIIKRTKRSDGGYDVTYQAADGTLYTKTEYSELGADQGEGTGGGSNANVPSLAKDVFKNTLALFFGATEMAKPWADELYTTVSKYYKSGATVDESFNLALQDAYQRKAMPEFTNRFKGIFRLQEQRQAGKPVTVPTIAEYFATQTKMADLLKTTGLNDLATEDFLGDVIGKGVSATEFGLRITNIFDRIDLAPQEMKDTLARYFPSLDRTQLAKALALGEKGSMQLQKELAGYEVLAAAEEQGLGALGTGGILGGLTEERAASLAAAGETYQSALGKFKTVGQIVQPAAKLAGIYGTGPMTQEDIENIVFKQSARETQALENLVNLEQSAFSGQAGTIGSRSFASQARGAGLI